MELKDSIKEIIAEIEKRGDVKAVFGEPVREGGLIVIPVASIMVAGGGGGGMQDGDSTEGLLNKMKGKGFGLGYKKAARPVGYIKIENGRVKFEPIADWQKMFFVAMAVFGLGSLLMAKLALKMKFKHLKHMKHMQHMHWDKQGV